MSTPHSPPDSPPAAMAVESAAVTLRKRLSDAPAKSDNNGVLASEIVNPIQPGEVIQVPSTNPANERQSQDKTHDIRVEEEEDEPKDEAVNDSDLARFDWEDLQARYTKALQEANEEEDKILEEFNTFAEAFSVWAQASAQYDNERAFKRLKTRERYVQLWEHSLEEKKNHYVQVVQAFKSALDMLVT